MKKRWITFFCVVFFVYVFVGRSQTIKKQIQNWLQVDLFWGTIVTYQENHDSWFHDDGETIAVLRIPKFAENHLITQLENQFYWEQGPIPVELQDVVYEYTLVDSFRESFADASGLSEIQRGYWCFVDMDTHKRENRIIYGYEAVADMVWPVGQEYIYWDYPSRFVVGLYDLDRHTLYFFFYTV